MKPFVLYFRQVPSNNNIATTPRNMSYISSRFPTIKALTKIQSNTNLIIRVENARWLPLDILVDLCHLKLDDYIIHCTEIWRLSIN